MLIEFAPHVSLRRTSTGVVMLFDQADGIMYELNDTASDIAIFLTELGPCDAGQIRDALLSNYDAEPDQIGMDVDALLGDFTERGLIRDAQPSA